MEDTNFLEGGAAYDEAILAVNRDSPTTGNQASTEIRYLIQKLESLRNSSARPDPKVTKRQKAEIGQELVNKIAIISNNFSDQQLGELVKQAEAVQAKIKGFADAVEAAGLPAALPAALPTAATRPTVAQRAELNAFFKSKLAQIEAKADECRVLAKRYLNDARLGAAASGLARTCRDYAENKKALLQELQLASVKRQNAEPDFNFQSEFEANFQAGTVDDMIQTVDQKIAAFNDARLQAETLAAQVVAARKQRERAEEAASAGVAGRRERQMRDEAKQLLEEAKRQENQNEISQHEAYVVFVNAREKLVNEFNQQLGLLDAWKKNHNEQEYEDVNKGPTAVQNIVDNEVADFAVIFDANFGATDEQSQTSKLGVPIMSAKTQNTAINVKEYQETVRAAFTEINSALNKLKAAVTDLQRPTRQLEIARYRVTYRKFPDQRTTTLPSNVLTILTGEEERSESFLGRLGTLTGLTTSPQEKQIERLEKERREERAETLQARDDARKQFRDLQTEKNKRRNEFKALLEEKAQTKNTLRLLNAQLRTDPANAAAIQAQIVNAEANLARLGDDTKGEIKVKLQEVINASITLNAFSKDLATLERQIPGALEPGTAAFTQRFETPIQRIQQAIDRIYTYTPEENRPLIFRARSPDVATGERLAAIRRSREQQKQELRVFGRGSSSERQKLLMDYVKIAPGAAAALVPDETFEYYANLNAEEKKRFMEKLADVRAHSGASVYNESSLPAESRAAIQLLRTDGASESFIAKVVKRFFESS